MWNVLRENMKKNVLLMSLADTPVFSIQCLLFVFLFVFFLVWDGSLYSSCGVVNSKNHFTTWLFNWWIYFLSCRCVVKKTPTYFSVKFWNGLKSILPRRWYADRSLSSPLQYLCHRNTKKDAVQSQKQQKQMGDIEWIVVPHHHQ